MSSVENKAIGRKTAGPMCSHCGAKLEPADTVCWLCLTPLGQPVANPRGAKARAAEVRPLATGNYSLASLMMFVTLVAVNLGIITQWPGIGVPMAIISFVIWSRTVNVVRQRATEGVEVSPLQKMLIFMSSFTMTVVVLVLIIVTGGAALGAACAAMFATADAAALPWLIGFGTLAIGGILSLIYIFRAINRRNARPRS